MRTPRQVLSSCCSDVKTVHSLRELTMCQCRKSASQSNLFSLVNQEPKMAYYHKNNHPKTQKCIFKKKKKLLFTDKSQCHRILTITVKWKKNVHVRIIFFFSKTLQFLVGWCHVTDQNDYDYLPLTVNNICNKFCSICGPFIAANR